MKAFKSDTLEKDERYTLEPTIQLCKPLAGLSTDDEYTMDVAACEASHWAPLYYTKERSGLDVPWYGDVWCNPPFSDIGAWVRKVWSERARIQINQPSSETVPRSISMLLPSNRTDTKWWQTHVEPFRDAVSWPLKTYFLPRQKFGAPGNPEGKPMKVGGKTKYSSPPFGCVLLVWR